MSGVSIRSTRSLTDWDWPGEHAGLNVLIALCHPTGGWAELPDGCTGRFLTRGLTSIRFALNRFSARLLMMMPGPPGSLCVLLFGTDSAERQRRRDELQNLAVLDLADPKSLGETIRA